MAGMSIPVFITCRDRVASLRLLVERLESMTDIGPIFLVDNDSKWPPMLDYLASTTHQVVRLAENAGHRAIWAMEVHQSLRESGPFVVTDPDVIPDQTCPEDTVDRLLGLLDEHPTMQKVGLGLHIDDLPDTNRLAKDVIDWESQFWEREISPGVYDAAVDTTFALYRAGAGPEEYPAIRTGTPYLARHLPWYDDPDSPCPEEIFYRARTREDSTNWHGAPFMPPLAAALARRRRRLEGLVDHPLLDAWAAEPPLTDESAFTPWIGPGWFSWNAMSAERDFCEFVGLLTRILQPGLVVETGVGQGYTTRRVASGLDNGTHICFENDSAIRAGLSALPFFAHDQHVLMSEPIPSAEDFARSDLTILDSEPPDRYTELEGWRASARPGSVLVVHDCGNGHPEGTPHAHLRHLVEELDIPGVFLRNPRGAFMGVHPGEAGPGELRRALQEAQQRMADAVNDLEAIRASHSWLVTRPMRVLVHLARRRDAPNRGERIRITGDDG
jgi:hypothetical protein